MSARELCLEEAREDKQPFRSDVSSELGFLPGLYTRWGRSILPRRMSRRCKKGRVDKMSDECNVDCGRIEKTY